MKKLLILLFLPIVIYGQAGNSTNAKIQANLDSIAAHRGELNAKNDSLQVARNERDSLFLRNSSWVNIEEHIGAYDTSAGWSYVIQAAIDANPNKLLIFKANKTYELQQVKVNPNYAGHKTCIDLGSGNVSLIIPYGTILKLKDGQQTDAGGAVDIITFKSATNIYIGGGGTITGNTAGQTGWTGGYDQVANGCIIYGISNNASSINNDYITIENINFKDHFSNAISLSGSYHLRAKDLTATGLGEGFSFDLAYYFETDNLDINDSTDVMVGDAIEFAGGRYGHVNNSIVRNSSVAAGVALEFTNSQDVIINGFVVDDWIGGVNNFGNCRNMTLTNGRVSHIGGNALYINGYSAKISDVTITNCNIGLIVYQQNDSLGVINNLTFKNCVEGVLLYGTRKLEANDCQFLNNTYGIFVENTGNGGGRPKLDINGGLFDGNTTTALYIRETFNPIINITGGTVFRNNGSNIQTSNDSTYIDDSVVRGISTNSASAGVLTIDYTKEVRPSNTNAITSISRGGYKQTVKIIFASGGTLVNSGGTSAGQVVLKGGLAEGFQGGESLTLQKRDSLWYEVTRTLTGNGSRGVVQVVDGWLYDDIGADVSSATSLNRNTAGVLGSRFYLSRDCKVKAWGISSSESVTAGTLTVQLLKNGISIKTMTLTSGTSNTTRYYRSSLVDFDADDYVEIKYLTSSDFLPVTADISVWVEFEY